MEVHFEVMSKDTIKFGIDLLPSLTDAGLSTLSKQLAKFAVANEGLESHQLFWLAIAIAQEMTRRLNLQQKVGS